MLRSWSAAVLVRRTVAVMFMASIPVAARSQPVEQLPIHVVYVNHVEVESVVDCVPSGACTATSENYAFTSGQIDWEIAQAEAVGARISFHMSGAYAERAVDAGHQSLWAQRLANDHAVGIHFHSFLRGAAPFQWIQEPSPTQTEIVQAWQDNHDLVAGLVGAQALWIGESHYGCPSCWDDLGYRLKTTEAMALLPADQGGQHIVWLVERNPSGVITYPHYPQIGQAGWHGPSGNRIYFDLRIGQLKKEFLMLYLEWLERERLGLDAQMWAWGWANHGGRSTQQHATEIQEILSWLNAEFVGQTSPRGHQIARFVGDHELSDIYEDYETWGNPLPSPLGSVNDQFPYMADALADAGVTADLSADLALAGVRLFELERDPPEDPLPAPLPRVYLLFRESDGTDVVDLTGVLASRGVVASTLTLINVFDGSTSQADPANLALGSMPMVLEVDTGTPSLPQAFFAVHCEPTTANSAVWAGLANLVGAADARGIKLTLEFTPQWADMILADPAKRTTVAGWQAAGHEIAGQHHPYTHPGSWDGYSNDPATTGDPVYRGNMADYMAVLNALAAPELVRTLGNPEDNDWPAGPSFRTEGNTASEAISVPTWEQPNGQCVWRLGYGALVSPPRLEELIALYPTATPDEVFGVVTHAFNYLNDPGMIEGWWDYLLTQDPTGSRNRTVTEILSGLSAPGDTTDSPFGFHPAGIGVPGYPDNGFVDAQNIGVRWHRPPAYAFWFAIQPDRNDPTYDWTIYDQQYGSVPQGIHILANIAPDHPRQPHGYTQPESFIPIDVGQYIDFVRATVDRYNGDGDANDMLGLVNPIKHWQVANEPDDQFTSGFAVLQQITYQAIKQACPDCTVLIGGVAGFPDDYVSTFDSRYAPILAQLGGQYVDVFDFHWYGNAEGEYRFMDTATGQDAYQYILDTLAANGFAPDLPIWITEMGSYSGDPAEPRFGYQSESQQAGDYFKRFIYSLSNGIDKVFPAFGLMESFGPSENGYFDHTGLIYDGSSDADDLGLGVKKLGYYTYRKMTEKLEGADWSTITLLRDGTGSDQLYVARVTKDGRPIHIAWWDTFDDAGYTPGATKDIVIASLFGPTASTTDVVPDYANGLELINSGATYETVFATTEYPIIVGTVTIPLGQDPVIIETDYQPGDFDGDGDVDSIDYTAFLACTVGPNGGSLATCCGPGDFDADDDIDLADFAAFQRAFSAP